MLLHMLWTYLTYVFSVQGLQLVKQLIIKFDQSVIHSLLFKKAQPELYQF